MRSYLIGETADSHAVADGETPTLAVEAHVRDMAQRFGYVCALQLWVRLAHKGSKWVLFRLLDGKAKRAKSLEVGNGTGR
jgi:hypothetical protein